MDTQINEMATCVRVEVYSALIGSTGILLAAERLNLEGSGILDSTEKRVKAENICLAKI